jgi:hypothetical protein
MLRVSDAGPRQVRAALPVVGAGPASETLNMGGSRLSQRKSIVRSFAKA